MKKIAFALLAAITLTTIGSTAAQAATVEPEVISDNPYQALSWTFPAYSNYITSPYGWRGTEFHKGFDIGISYQPVFNTQSGTVLSAGVEASMGTYVSVKTVDTAPGTTKKLTTRYLHLSSKSVNTGNAVTIGQQLGVSGNTGASYGAHLHFDVNQIETYNGSIMNELNTIDPKLFWPQRPYTYVSSGLAAATTSSKTFTGQIDHTAQDNDFENYFEDTLINYVGQDKFEQWMLSRPESSRKVSKFKKDFGITDKLQKQLHDQAFQTVNLN